MKALIAATCIAVLTAVGYFFWGEYSRYAAGQAQAAEAMRQQAVADRMQISGPNCRDFVREIVEAHDSGSALDERTHRLVRLCISSNELWPFDRDELKRVGRYDQYATAD